MFHIKNWTTKALLVITGGLVLMGVAMIGTGLYYGNYWAGLGLVLAMTSVMLFVVNLLHDENFSAQSVSNISQGRKSDSLREVS